MGRADYWDRQADSFDEQPDHGLADPATREAWRSLLLGVLPPAPAEVADLGCGTGSLSVLLADNGYRLRGLDFSSRMVERAQAKAAAAGVTADFQLGDVASPPWPPATFDAVLCRHVLWALPDPGQALDRWAALLEPAGRLLLVEGRWRTGAGITAEEAEELLRQKGRRSRVIPLTDPVYWGGPIDDERYLLVSTVPTPQPTP
ncbi:MAG TPA: methyltransferase domain-containing protein [Acidimicrobiales bacterium]|nr:methyltransferase domain-containing protein [Acidimicrobiales bacterium]